MPSKKSSKCAQTRAKQTAAAAEPLRISFDPPLYLQRRMFVFSTLIKQTPGCVSLLDVGTGQGDLLAYLRRCDDDTPLQNMVGIDPDYAELERAVQNTRPNDADTGEERWRPLNISLYHGGVADLTKSFGQFDCITALEVLEHLDPPDVRAFSERCLGVIRPRLMIVTTPNRDFNKVFERLETDNGHRFHRPGIEYAMRHSDHRFEMSRLEFQDWARLQCSEYFYHVEFSGVGTIENAFVNQSRWQTSFPETDPYKAFGFCTQIAVFHRRALPIDIPQTLSINSRLVHVETHMYPFGFDTGLPSPVSIMAQAILEAEPYFRPYYNPETDYAGVNVDKQRISIWRFFDTCYRIRRLTHFRLKQFYATIRTMSHARKFLLAKPSTFGQACSATDNEIKPEAVLKRVELLYINKRYSLLYIFDVTAFAAYQQGRREAQACDDHAGYPEAEVPDIEAWDETPRAASPLDQAWSCSA